MRLMTLGAVGGYFAGRLAEAGANSMAARAHASRP